MSFIELMIVTSISAGFGAMFGLQLLRWPWFLRIICQHRAVTVVVDPTLGLAFETCDVCGHQRWHEPKERRGR